MYLADQGGRHQGRAAGRRDGDAKESGLWLAFNRGKRRSCRPRRRRAGRSRTTSRPAGRRDAGRVAARGRGSAGDADTRSSPRSTPRIVYFSLTGWGYDGPLTMKLGWDIIVQGFSGVMDSQRTQDGTPVAASFYVADVAIPMYMAYARARAVAARQVGRRARRSRRPRCRPRWRCSSSTSSSAREAAPTAQGRGTGAGPRRTFQAADGEYLVMAGEAARVGPAVGAPRAARLPERARMGPLAWPKEMATSGTRASPSAS